MAINSWMNDLLETGDKTESSSYMTAYSNTTRFSRFRSSIPDPTHRRLFWPWAWSPTNALHYHLKCRRIWVRP